MSMYYSYYVGPYIQCYFHYDEKEVNKKGCSVCDDEKQWGNNFCSRCGNKIGNYIKFEKIKSVNYWDLLEDTFIGTGEITFDNFDILICNGEKSEENRWFDITYDVKLQEIKPHTIVEELAWFERCYTKEIKVLKEYYDIIEIKWGLLKYIHK